jgi:hypothetical protein
MQNLNNSKSIHNVLRSQLHLLPISSTQQRPRHHLSESFPVIIQKTQSKDRRSKCSCDMKRPNVSSKQWGDLPTRPPARSAETDWICCGAPLGDLSHGRRCNRRQMKQEKKKRSCKRERLDTKGSSALHLQAWWSPEVGDVDEASNTRSGSVSIYMSNRFQDYRYCTQCRYMLLGNRF